MNDQLRNTQFSVHFYSTVMWLSTNRDWTLVDLWHFLFNISQCLRLFLSLNNSHGQQPLNYHNCLTRSIVHAHMLNTEYTHSYTRMCIDNHPHILLMLSAPVAGWLTGSKRSPQQLCLVTNDACAAQQDWKTTTFTINNRHKGKYLMPGATLTPEHDSTAKHNLFNYLKYLRSAAGIS